MEIILIKDSNIILFMILTSDILKKVLMAIPDDDFTIEYADKKSIVPLEDKIEIDISGKRIIFRS